MRWMLWILGFAGAIAALCAPWGGKRARAVNVLGSTSVQPFAEMLSQEFNARNPGQVVDVQGGGSTAGIQAAKEGIADVGMCSRELKADEKAIFNRIEIARDGLAIVVHTSNKIESLHRDQIRAIFAGEIRNWKDVGGDNQEIRLITREEGSGTREAFMKLVMGKSRISPAALTQESNGSVKELVRDDSCAIGFMSLGLVGRELKALKVDGCPATVAQVKDKTNPYPLVRPFLFVTRKDTNSEKASKFIEYVLSKDGQALLEREGLVGK